MLHPGDNILEKVKRKKKRKQKWLLLLIYSKIILIYVVAFAYLGVGDNSQSLYEMMIV